MKLRGFEYCKGYEGITGLPVRATKKSAGYDFFCPKTITVMPGQTEKVITGIKAYMQPWEVLLLFPRSSMGIKHNICLANTVGVIDADYYNNLQNEGNIIIAVHNNGNKLLQIGAGERFAQGVFLPFLVADNAGELGEDRNGGVGSTGR